MSSTLSTITESSLFIVLGTHTTLKTIASKTTRNFPPHLSYVATLPVSTLATEWHIVFLSVDKSWLIRPTDNQCSEKFQVLTDMSMSMMYLPSEHEVTNKITFFTVCRSLSTEPVSYVLAASEDFDRCKF